MFRVVSEDEPKAVPAAAAAKEPLPELPQQVRNDKSRVQLQSTWDLRHPFYMPHKEWGPEDILKCESIGDLQVRIACLDAHREDLAQASIGAEIEIDWCRQRIEDLSIRDRKRRKKSGRT